MSSVDPSITQAYADRSRYNISLSLWDYMHDNIVVGQQCIWEDAERVPHSVGVLKP